MVISLLRSMVPLVVALCVGIAGMSAVGTASAGPSFPPAFPSDQNQLPQLPSEPDIYDQLPIPTPEDDPWYTDPSNLGSYAAGQIVRTREVQTRILGIPFPVYTKQLLFRSNDVHNRPIVTATSLIVPGIPWEGSPRPVLSFQEAIDSTDSSCNPSHTLQTGTMKESALLIYWLGQGFAINIPDFDGKFNTFNTYDEGKMVLDSLRAVKNDKALGLRDSGIVLYGYSGGGSGSVRAAELRESYAPDVHLLGSAFGGFPADLAAQVEYASEPQPGLTGLSNFTMWLGWAALSRSYPDQFKPADILDADGQQLVADAQRRCYATLALGGFYRPISAYFQPGKSLATAPAIAQVLEDNSLGKHIPDTPIFWWHGVWDELIPPADVVLPTVQSYWDRGADMRFYSMPLPEQFVNAVVGWPPAVAWTTAVLRGLPPGPRFKADLAPLPENFPGG